MDPPLESKARTASLPEWWNWQTRTFEGRVGKPMRVRVPPPAPSKELVAVGVQRDAQVAHARRRERVAHPLLHGHTSDVDGGEGRVVEDLARGDEVGAAVRTEHHGRPPLR